MTLVSTLNLKVLSHNTIISKTNFSHTPGSYCATYNTTTGSYASWKCATVFLVPIVVTWPFLCVLVGLPIYNFFTMPNVTSGARSRSRSVRHLEDHNPRKKPQEKRCLHFDPWRGWVGGKIRSQQWQQEKLPVQHLVPLSTTLHTGTQDPSPLWEI